jgi:NADPH-dependent FMN reductase
LTPDAPVDSEGDSRNALIAYLVRSGENGSQRGPFFSPDFHLMRHILVVHHSASGGTRSMVNAFRDGAAGNDAVALVTRSASIATAAEVIAADALVIATPENFGYMAGSIKEFFDRIFYACMSDTTALGGGTQSMLAGRPYAVLVCAGNDGTGAMQSVDRIITGWRMRKIHDGVIARRVGGEAGSSRGQLRSDDLDACRELGQLFVEGLAIGAI